MNAYDGQEQALRFIHRVLDEKYTLELHELYNVADPDAPISADSVHLPGLGKSYIAGGIDLANVSRGSSVIAYTYPSAASEDSPRNSQNQNLYTLSGDGDSVEARLLFATVIMISKAPFEQINLNGRNMDQKEVLTIRASRYLGALKHTLYKWCCLRPEARRLEFISDYSNAGEVNLAPTPNSTATQLMGVAHLEYYIDQDQELPKMQRLPDITP